MFNGKIEREDFGFLLQPPSWGTWLLLMAVLSVLYGFVFALIYDGEPYRFTRVEACSITVSEGIPGWTCSAMGEETVFFPGTTLFDTAKMAGDELATEILGEKYQPVGTGVNVVVARIVLTGEWFGGSTDYLIMVEPEFFLNFHRP